MSDELARIEVLGVRETLAQLKQLDPELRRESVAAMRRAAKPMQEAARALVPVEPPLSGMARKWAPKGRQLLPWTRKARTGITLRYGGKYSRSTTSWPLLALRQANPAGVVFDMAGRKSSSAFADRITSRYGMASRSMWRAAESHLSDVQDGVRQAADEAAKTVSRKIVDYRP